MKGKNLKDSQKLVAITVRMPQALKDFIATAAKKERRSINNQIVYMLEKSLKLIKSS